LTHQSHRRIAYAAAGAGATAAIAVFFAHGAERADLPPLLLGGIAGGALIWAASLWRRNRLAMTEALFENVTDYISIVDAEGRVLQQSPSVARQLGHAAEPRAGLSALGLVHPEDLPEVRRALDSVLRKPGGTSSFRHRVRRQDGSWRVLDSHLKNLLHAPAVRGIVVSSRDVTDRVRAEVRQATQLAVTRILNEATSIAAASPSILEAICRCAGWDLGEVWCADGRGDVLRWKGSWHLPGVNGAAFDAVSRETTFARGQGLPGRVWECGTPAWLVDVAEDPEFVRRTAAKSEGLHAALAFPVGKGATSGVLVFFSHELREPDLVLLDVMAEVGMKIGQFVENRQADEALRDSEERFHRLSETTAEGVVIHDANVIVDANQAMTRITGYAREELVGRNGFDLVLPESRQFLAQRLAQGVVGRVEIVAKRKDGSSFPAEIDSRTIGYRGGTARVWAVRDITDCKQAEAAMGKLSSAAEQTADSVVITDLAGVIEYANPAFERMTGYAPSEVAGRTMALLKSGRHDEAFYKGLWTTILGGEVFRGEFVNRKKSGELYHQEETISPVKDARGQITHFVSTGRDVTSRRLGEEALAKLSRAVEQTADTVFITDRNGVIEYVNQAFERSTGFHREEALGQTPRLLASGLHDKAFYEHVWATILSGQTFRGEFINKKKNGEVFYEAKTITPILDAAGQITHFVATGGDITGRKRAEARENAHFAVTRILAEAPGLRQAVPAILEAVCRGMEWDFGELWLVDAEGRYLTWYDSWHPADHDMPGFESASRSIRFARGEGLPGRVWGTGAPAWVPDVIEDPGFLRKPFARQAGLHGAVGFPIRGSSALNGVMVFLSGRVREPEEAVLRTMEDIGRQLGQFIERKRAEEEEERLQRTVRRSALEWRLTFDAIESPILMVDLQGRVVRLNRAAQESAGESYEEILGRPVEAIRPPTQPWCTAAALAREAAEARAAQVVHVKDETTGRTWDLAAALVTASASEGEERIIIVASDVTRIVELQESLRRSETMSAMGSLVAGVAHEVRNPLFSISANIDAFEAQFGDREEYRETLQVLRSEVDRLGGLMQALLDYGKPPALEMAERGLEDVIAQAVHACRPRATGDLVTLTNDVKRGLPAVLMDRKRLVQVFQNLIENAVQHSPARGTVRISARADRQADEDYVQVLVEDSGPGFAEEDLPRIFEPFFTRRRGGTGLGLSIVARIVEEHGGRIAARNRAEGGAVMAVRLPCRGGRTPNDQGGVVIRLTRRREEG
jgi:PAS domain S-box-containing protein